MQLENRTEKKIIFALGTMLHDFQIVRRISSTTIERHRINVAAQRAKVCAYSCPQKKNEHVVIGFVRSNRGC